MGRIGAVHRREQGVTCVFSQPQFSESLGRTGTEGTEVRTARLDPLGTEIALGPEFYPALIGDTATRFADGLQ
jgi:zinc transport system substrate-binding protein